MQICINSAVSNDTINVSAGSATWAASAVTISGKALTLTGATICTGTGNPASNNLSCVDNTIITVTGDGALNLLGSATNLVTVSGFTFSIGASSSNGIIQLQGTHGQVSFRFHHNHIKMPTASSVAVVAFNGYGLLDHIQWEDTVAAGTGAVPMDCGGDFPTHGYLNWNDPTNFGSNQAVYVEDSSYTTTHTNTEGLFDGFYGCKIVIRYSTITGNEIGGWHGTDSGQYRSGVLGEIYNNSISNSTGTPLGLMNTRGGTLIFSNNTVGGSTAWSAIDLQYYRISNQIASQISTWGAAGTGLNWTPISTTATNVLSDINTLNAPDWQSAHTYTCSAGSPCLIGPLTNNTGNNGTFPGSGGFNYEATANCVSGGSVPSPWNQTVSGTQSDGTCTWTNIGGGTTAGPGATGFDATNPDTACSSGVNCTRYFDSNGGVYPFRDQPGVIHNQVVKGNYACGNSGAGLPNPLLVTDAGTSAIIQSGRDYFNNTCMPGYTPYTYPHPLQGAPIPPAPCLPMCLVAVPPPTNLRARLQ